MAIDKEYLGYNLLKRGFPDWFRYMFRVVEGRPFIIEPIHNDLLFCIQDIYNGLSPRQVINMPPRSAKTTLMSYFTAYGFTANPISNFIYTSYSQTLLKEISSKVCAIMEHPAYKAMYPNLGATAEREELDPVDDFWKDYLFKEQKKNTYTSQKIQTAQGGLCLLASIGAQITGYGCGTRNSKRFSGALIIDDANKPADVHHEKKRNKVLTYFEETLLTRLNSPDIPIINVQQRLHVADLSGLLKEKYNFHTLKKPLLDENEVCQIPSQYTAERIKELQKNNYMFSSQYQQEPIILGGQVFKRSWFQYFSLSDLPQFKRVLIAADTAMKTKEHNDFSVFIVGGVTNDNKLYILDLIRGKWEAPELEQTALNIWNRFKRNERTGLICNGLYIEDKASGTGLIQGLKTKYGIPVFGVGASVDKLTRAEDILPYVEAGQIFLPSGENYGFVPEFLNECEAFSRNMSHLHDDQVDAFGILVKEALSKTVVSILDFAM